MNKATTKPKRARNGVGCDAIVGARRRKKSVWEKLANAYDRKTGLRLTGEDVDTLYLMDTAVRAVVDETRDQSPNTDYAARGCISNHGKR